MTNTAPKYDQEMILNAINPVLTPSELSPY